MRCFDVIAAVIVLVVTAPLAVLAAGAVKLTSKGQLLLREQRVGRRGRPFEMLSFRTTHVDRSGDVRMTRVGHVLVACAIDDLPRWWNVLRGDLGVVGVQPARPGEPRRPDPDCTGQWPGMTGIWRTAGR